MGNIIDRRTDGTGFWLFKQYTAKSKNEQTKFK